MIGNPPFHQLRNRPGVAPPGLLLYYQPKTGLKVAPRFRTCAPPLAKSLGVLPESQLLRFRLKALPDEAFDLSPEMRIAFALHVAGSKRPLDPSHAFTLDWLLSVVEAVVAQDLCLAFVCRSNHRSPVEKSVRLIEVHRRRYILRNHVILLPGFGDAIYLHRKHDWNADAVQLARQDNHGRTSPTLTKQNDPRPGLFFSAQNTVAVCVDQVQNIAIGSLSVAVFIDLDVRALRGKLMHLLRDYDRSVMWIGVPNESSNKTDKDIGDSRHILDGCRRRTTLRNPEQENDQKTGMRSSEAKHAELPHHFR